jgi:chromosome segregation ATPase/LysM repeat protein
MKEMKESYERRLEAAMSTMDGGDLERFAALQDELNRNAGRLAATEVEISSLREQASGLEDALVVARSAMDSLQKEKVEIERVLSDERALVEELSRRDAMNREELLNLTARLNDAQPSVEQVTAHATDAETEAPAVAESELAVVDMQTRHDGLLARIGELETERETLRDTIAAHVSEIEGLRGKVIPALEQERDRLVTEREELVQKLAATSEERDQYRKEAEMALEQADVLQNAVAEANGKAENLQADKQQLESVLNDERALVEQLTQRRREDEGALEGLKTQVADADRIHQEALAKLQDAVDEQHAALEAKEGEVIGALEARRSLEEELRQAHELNEALESLIESQKSELAQVAKVELPAALETRDKFRQELDGARKECDALREERGTLQAQVDRLEVALEASGGTVREFEERLGMSDRTLREVSHELKIETDERRRLDQWKMRSMMAHAAAVLLAVGLLIYAVGGRTRVSDHGVRVDSAGTTEGVAGADGQPANSTTPTDTAPSITPGQSIPEFQGPPGATPTQAIEEEARTFAVNANPQSGSGTSGAKTAAAGATSETKQGEPKRYTLKKGDSLWLVAKREYGDPQRWKDIAKANNLDSRESRLLRPGYELILP